MSATEMLRRAGYTHREATGEDSRALGGPRAYHCGRRAILDADGRLVALLNAHEVGEWLRTRGGPS